MNGSSALFGRFGAKKFIFSPGARCTTTPGEISIVRSSDAVAGAAPASGEPSARLAVPAYRSALDGFPPYRADEPLRGWREVNDEVGRLGGHMGHLRGQSREESGEREAGR